MDQNREAAAPMDVLPERMRTLRKNRHLTAQQLADEMTRVGVAWERIVVSRLETGRRQSVSVAELLALAYVLNTSPLALLVSTDNRACQLTPTVVADAQAAWQWAAGDGPLRVAGGAPSDFLERVDYLRTLPAWKQQQQKHQLLESDEDEIEVPIPGEEGADDGTA